MNQSTQSPSQTQLPNFEVKNTWQEVFDPVHSQALLATLQDYLYTRRWFGGKAKTISSAQIVEKIPISYRDTKAIMVWLEVEYAGDDKRETYVLLLGYESGKGIKQLQVDAPGSIVAQLQVASKAGVIFEATADRDFLSFPLAAIADFHRYQGEKGELIATPTEIFTELRGGTIPLEPRLIKAEQSNTSIIYGDRLILKFFRKLEPGLNPDLEIGRFLSQHGHTEHFASIAGALEYQKPGAEPTSVATLQQFIANTEDAWQYTLKSIESFFTQAREQDLDATVPTRGSLDLEAAAIPETVPKTIGSYWDHAQLLGQRTAELHVALASDSENPDFAPESFSSSYQQSVNQYLQTLIERNFGLLKERLDSLTSENQQLAKTLLERQESILKRFGSFMKGELTALRTRVHGDYHLGQVLYTGKDFIIIDFEGEPARPLIERRMKRSPLADVAGMLQSFNYAANMGLRNQSQSGKSEQWAQFWFAWISAAFLKAYLEKAGTSFLPQTDQELANLLNVYLFEKAVYELGYELNNRPDWVDIPLKRLLQLEETSVNQH